MEIKKRSKWGERLGYVYIYSTAFIIFTILIIILLDISVKGISVINWEFLFTSPREGMTKGGILPCIIGTFAVSVITVIFSVPLGIFSAIYLNEYAKDTKLTRLIRIAIRNLSGVPSIVYGLFGVALFVDLFHFGTSILSAGLTLGLLTLPWTITSSEEALKTVPKSYREGALALGATKWQAIRTNVLPYALPGILTGTILGLSRAAGETAPILFTGAAFFLPHIPSSLFDQFMALPYHLYIMSTQHHDIEGVRPIAYGTAFVLIAIVLLMNLAAIRIRYKYRKKIKGRS
jgi:phosphate transport system permease protein